jgi:hypothetical protein
MNRAPLVTVGLPVHNGEEHLAGVLQSLQNQTVSDFELVISDNASSDATADICRQAAQSDPRIRYVRQAENLGAPANWNFVARQARGSYFKWASDSDLCAPRFLEACLKPMQADPAVVLSMGRTQYIDAEGRPTAIGGHDLGAVEGAPSERFVQVCMRLGVNNEQYGLIRTVPLLRTRLDRLYPHGDLVLMAELALLGKFAAVDEQLLARRMAPGHWARLMTVEQLDRMFWPGGPRPMRLVLVRRHADYLRTALLAPIPWAERLRAARFAARFAYWKKQELGRDLMGALRGVTRRKT